MDTHYPAKDEETLFRKISWLPSSYRSSWPWLSYATWTGLTWHLQVGILMCLCGKCHYRYPGI